VSIGAGGVNPDPAPGAAFVSGLRRHPILGPAFDTAASVFGYDREALQRLEDQVGPETTSEQLAGFVGQFGPDFLLGGAAFSGGRALALRGLQAIAQGKQVGQLGLVAARRARDLEVAAGGPIRQLGSAWSETLAKTLGGQAATAAFFGGETYLETGGDTRQALETAALVAAVGGVLEGVPIGLARVLGKSTRTSRVRAAELDQPALRARAEKSQAERLADFIETAQGGRKLGVRGRKGQVPLPALRGQLAKIQEQVDLALDVERTSGNLLAAGEREAVMAARGAKLQEIARAERNVVALRQQAGRSGADIQLTTDEPFAPQGLAKLIFEVGRRVGVTPESLMGRMGATAAKFFSSFLQTEMRTNLAVTTQIERVRQMRATAFRALGLNPQTRNAAQRTALWRTIHEWEKLGPTGARQTLEEANRHTEGMLTRLRDAGVIAQWTDEDFLTQRVSHYWTHIGDPKLDDAQQYARLLAFNNGDDRLTDSMMHSIEALGARPSQKLRRNPGPTSRSAVRVGKFAAFDYARVIPGTGFEKLRRGLPINDDPFDSLARYLAAGERRDHFSRLVGPDGRMVDAVADGVQAEVTAIAGQRALRETAGRGFQRREPAAEGKDAANMFTNITDELLDHKYYTEGVNRITRLITSLNVGSKLALSFIPQITQAQNIVYTSGVTAAARGFMGLVRSKSRREAQLALAIPHMASRAQAGMLDAGVLSARSERFAEMVLKYTGFEPLEKGLRVHSFWTGNAVVRDDLAKAAAGRLRGTNLDAAIRRQADLGVDLPAQVARLRRMGPEEFFNDAATVDMLELAGYRAAQRTQFIPSRSRKPTLWDHPVGRIAFQFKTFALGQARLIKDTVLTEAALGNLRPLAYWYSLAPLSGAFIVSAKDLFREEPREFTDHPVSRVLELAMSAGGFGLAGDLFYSALHGDLAGALAGPTAGQAFKVGEALAQRDVDALIRSGVQLPLARLATTMFSAGLGAHAMTEDLVDQYLDATSPGGTATIDFGSAVFRQRLEAQQRGETKP
jgi:hypothetical protein